MLSYEEITFLRESNNIEGVWDDLSLQQAIHAWEYLRSKPKLSAHVVLKTHKILMLHQNLHPDEKGYFRKVPVWIAGREGHPVWGLREDIIEWCAAMNNSIGSKYIENEEHAKGTVVAMHINYETIHPFVDGNGRTGRMFMNWHCKKLGLPYLVILEKEKRKYYDWFK
jgi:Fic family protein